MIVFVPIPSALVELRGTPCVTVTKTTNVDVELGALVEMSGTPRVTVTKTTNVDVEV